MTEELQIRQNLGNAEYYLKHIEEDENYLTLSQKCIDDCSQILKKNIREGLISFSNETIINFAETAIKVQNRAYLSEEFINYFFQRNNQIGQFYVRALLLRAKIIMNNGQKEYLKAEEMIKNLKKSFDCIQKAIDIVSQNKQKYQFLAYNISVCAYQICHPVFRIQWQKYFLEYIEKIEKLLEEVYLFLQQLNDPDQEWRCKFSLILFQCLYDADKKADAVKIFERICDNAKKNNVNVEFQEYLLRLRISYGKENPALLASAKKEVDTSTDKSLKILSSLQQMKCGLIPEATIEKELISLVSGITSGGQSGQESSQNAKLSQQLQIRLAEAGRVALKYNLVNIADNIVSFLGRVRHLTLKAFIMNDYNKAELLVKKAGSIIDEQTGMKLSQVQIKRQEIQHGIQALKMLEKVMLANKNSLDADLIYEGAVLIWNIGIPFLNANYRKYCYQAFLQASKFLELIQCNDSSLRVNFHLELAKSDIQQDDLLLAEQQILKALSLDYSIPIQQVKFKYEQDEDLSLYQRPYDRVLKQLQQKVFLKMGTYAAPKNELEKTIIDLDKVKHQDTKKSQQIEILQRTFYGVLEKVYEKEYFNDPEKDLVEIEVEQEKKIFKQEQLNQFKQRKMLANEVAKIAFEIDQIDLAIDACKFVCKDQWELRNASDLILCQTECYFILARCIQERIFSQGYLFAYKDLIKRGEDDEDYVENNATQEVSDQIYAQKKEIIDYYLQGLKLAESLQQSWLLFNGGIHIWNSYLPYFKTPQNDSKLLPEILPLLKEYFDIMKNSLKELEKKQITDYDLESKIKVYANLSMVYARLNENKGNFEEVMRVCDSVLLTPINPQTRKIINAMKARVQGNAKQAIKAPDKKGATTTQVQGSDSIVFDVVQQLEVIQNSTNKQQVQELIKKCYESLQSWLVKENDETELELHAEIWTRFARLALNEDNNQMCKYSLRAVESALTLNKGNVPPSRIRWYSLAEHIYSETLLKLLNPESQEAEAQQKLLFHGLQHAVKAINLGSQSNHSILIVNAGKQIWNICEKLQDTAENRKALIQPILIALQNLKNVKEKSESDLVLLLSQLFFQACFENEEYKLGESIADILFDLVPKEQQKPIWEAKTIFISKQGKNELQAISNMREADNSLQAKMWIRLARASNNQFKQYNAYKTAIELLKKDHEFELVEVYIELSEWLLRNCYSKELIQENLLQAADILIDIELEDQGSESDEEVNESIFSRSSRGKKSFSKQSNLKSKAQKTDNKTKSIDNKTQKTQTKTIFKNRQEDQNPQQLNCFHLERLVRIHAMMAMIAENQDQQLQFCIDAYTFIIKMFQVSYDFLNKGDQNKEKYQNGQDQKNTNNQQKFELPQKFDDWINYQKPKEFIEKIKSQEDSNIISKYVFEKAEMTFFYIDYVIQIFEGNGLQVYNVPLFEFQKILAGEIIKNKYLVQSLEARYARTLNFLGITQKSEQILQQINFKNINLSTQDKLNLLNKTKSQKTSTSVNNQNNSPTLIKKILPHHTWITTAQELINQGELTKARILLDEALLHSKILQEYSVITKIKINIAQIEYIEGNYKSCLQTYMETHKLNREVKNWQLICIGTVQVLQKLNQIQDVFMFLNKIIQILQNLQNQQQYSYQKLDIQQTLSICYILKARCIAKKLRQNFTMDALNEAFDNILLIEKLQCGLNYSHITLLTKFYNKLSINIEQQSICDKQSVESCYKVVLFLIDRLLFLEKSVKSQLKYTANLEKQSFEIQGPLQIQYSKIKILLARCFVYNGVLKKKLRKMNSNLDIQYDQPKEEVNEVVSNYLKKLNHIIERSIMPIPKRLDSFEKAIAVITSVLPKINQKHYLYQIACVELARAKRYLAEQKSQMQQIWSQDNQSDEEDYPDKQLLQNLSVDFRLESFNYIREIYNSPDFQNIDNPFQDNQSFYHAKKLQKENLENFGIQHCETSFESLSKFQHLSFMEKIFQVLKKDSPSSYKPILLQKLQKSIIQNFNSFGPDIQNFMQKEFKVWNLLFQNISFNEVKDRLPNGSAYLILQLDNNNEHLFISLMSITQNRQFRFNCQRKTLTQQDLDTIFSFKQSFDQIKQILIKTPIVTEQDFKSIEDEENQNLIKLMEKFENYFQFISEIVNPFINEPIKDEEVETQAQTKGGKDSKKPGKTAEIQVKEVKKSIAGVESLVLLLDSKLQCLPFEKLSVFKDIGAKSRDTSLFILGKRYMNLNFQTDTKQMNGMLKDKLRYICYDFKNKNINLGNMVENIQKQLTVSKYNGTSSGKRIASFGEWTKELQNNTLMIFYAHDSLFDILSPQLFFNLIEINNTRTFMIQDNINSLKNQINQSQPLDHDSIKIPLNEQHDKLFLYLTLIGASSIALNQWSIRPEENIQQIDIHLLQIQCYNNKIESQIKSLDLGNVFAATLNDYQENQKPLYSHNQVFYGVPINRIC